MTAWIILLKSNGPSPTRHISTITLFFRNLRMKIQKETVALLDISESDIYGVATLSALG